MLSILVLTACTTPDIQMISIANGQTNGVTVADDASSFNAGMFDAACRVDLSGFDYMYEQDVMLGTEKVLDARNLGVLIGVKDELIVTDLNFNEVARFGTDTDENLVTVTDAQMTQSGVVALVEDSEQSEPQVDFYDEEGVTKVTLFDLSCTSNCSLSLEQEQEVVYVADGQSVVAVTKEGYTEIDNTEASLTVNYDPRTNSLITTSNDRANIQSVELDGSANWSIEDIGRVVSIDLAESAGVAFLMHEMNTFYRITAIRTLDGEIIFSSLIPDEAEVATDINARMIVLSTKDNAIAYRVNIQDSL